jgi:hypothetical protein
MVVAAAAVTAVEVAVVVDSLAVGATIGEVAAAKGMEGMEVIPLFGDKCQIGSRGDPERVNGLPMVAITSRIEQSKTTMMTTLASSDSSAFRAMKRKPWRTWTAEVMAKIAAMMTPTKRMSSPTEIVVTGTSTSPVPVKDRGLIRDEEDGGPRWQRWPWMRPQNRKQSSLMSLKMM